MRAFNLGSEEKKKKNPDAFKCFIFFPTLKVFTFA